jgi:hypothetical protein
MSDQPLSPNFVLKTLWRRPGGCTLEQLLYEGSAVLASGND